MAGFNLLAALEGEALVLHWDGTLRPVAPGPGPHVVSSHHDLDAPELPEREVFLGAFGGRTGSPDEDALKSFLSSHDGPRPVCKHGDGFGTVSSTILVDGPGGIRALHAPGPPCRTRFT